MSSSLQEAAVHPLVILSVIDHHRRVLGQHAHGRKVVGALLGAQSATRADILASFGVPFEEDRSDPQASFLDHNYMDAMADLHKKVSAKERLIGWYKCVQVADNEPLTWDEADAQLAMKLNANYSLSSSSASSSPLQSMLLVVFDASGRRAPQAFALGDLSSGSANTSGDLFSAGSVGMSAPLRTIECKIEAEEAEMVGVEHLLRDISEPPSNLLSSQVARKFGSLRELEHQLADLQAQLEQSLQSGSLDQTLLHQVQSLLNQLPTAPSGKDANEAINEQLVLTLVSSLSKCVCSLHDVIIAAQSSDSATASS